jgi:hypothetical protein
VSGVRAALAVFLLIACASPALAQRYAPTKQPHFGSLEAGIGLEWVRGIDFGEQRANELRNPTTGDTPLVLFVTRSRMSAVPGFQARLGLYLARNLVAEAGLRYSRPVLRTQALQDFEQAADASVSETLSQYLIDGSLVFHLGQFSRQRIVPFVRGGAGQVRDVHQRGELIETGTEYHGGGGLKLWLHGWGIRGDVGLSSRKGGFDLSAKRRTQPTASGSLIFRF